MPSAKSSRAVNKTELFETMPVPKALLTMAIPTIISQLINLIYNMVDAIYIGQTGDAYKTAAVTLAFTVFLLTISFGNLFGVGGGSYIARLMGKGETDRAKSVSAFSFYGAAVVSLLYSLVIGLFMDPILLFLGASENTLVFGRQYLIWVVVAGNLPTIVSGAGSHLLRNAGYSRQAGFGLPSAALTGLFDAANVVLNALMAAHGDLQLAAIGIVMKAERLPNAINVGIGQGMLPIVAYNYTSGNHKRMMKTISTARLWGFAISAATIVLYELFAGPVCSLFLNTNVGDNTAAGAAAIAFAIVFLRVRCLAAPVQFLNFETSFCMQAVGYGSGTLIHACVRELVFYIPFMYLLNRIFAEYGLASAIVFGEACGAVFALLLFRRWRKKHAQL